jgi:hypothetical protein
MGRVSSLINALPLTDADYDALEKSSIPRALADSACLFRVDQTEGARMFGRKTTAYHDYAGVIFPYFWPGEEPAREYRIRRDNPDQEMQPDGEIKETAKYLSPPGASSLLYFPPDVDPTWLDDQTMPKIICEGEKKTLALWHLAWCDVKNGRPRFLPIGLAGVWNWKRSVEIMDAVTGARRKVSSWISDFNRMDWKGQTVIILFDSNVHWNDSVKIARDRLAYLLNEWKAQVLLVNLPNIPGINGPDDFIHAKGPDAMLALINNAFKGVYPECYSASEHYALRDWAQIDDISRLLMAHWNWDAEDKETFGAINCTWGGRRSKTFALRQIDIYKRIKRMPDEANLTKSEIVQAKQFVRRRVEKLLATIERTLSIELLKRTEKGGKINPKNGHRLFSKYRVTHVPFLEAKRLAAKIMQDGRYGGKNVSSPGLAREIAAKVIGSKYMLENASAAIQDEHRAMLEQKAKAPKKIIDSAVAQKTFENTIAKHAKEVLWLMHQERATPGEIKDYFDWAGKKVSDFGKTPFSVRDRNAKLDQEDAGNFEVVMGVMSDTPDHDTHKDADALASTPTSDSPSTPPCTLILDNDAAKNKRVKVGPAIWRNAKHDLPVIVTGEAGIGSDGRCYATIEGSSMGVPADELVFEDDDSFASEMARMMGAKVPDESRAESSDREDPTSYATELDRMRTNGW